MLTVCPLIITNNCCLLMTLISVLFLNSLSSPETCNTLFVGKPKSCHMTGAFNKHRNYADAIMISRHSYICIHKIIHTAIRKLKL